MKHKLSERQLSAYVDNELSESDMQSVRTHVEGCAQCQQQVQVLRAIRMSIRDAASVVLPDTFVYSVQRAVRQQEQEYVIWLGPERFARNIVVALCVIVFALVAVGSYLTPQPVVGEERYFSGEPSDSAAHAVIGIQHELSKDDVMIAALSR
ncbi:MAG: zf-HC2 domain-containing protein [Ignavibacteriales bacterium]|nr:zf-HC2 domain-containing protein [Ignavibacteriales bacterium]